MTDKIAIEITKINSITAAEFKVLIKDPKVHLQFLRYRLRFHSPDNIENVFDRIDEYVTDIYYIDILKQSDTGVIYFWSEKDFFNFRS